jgi:hypothetical protein
MHADTLSLCFCFCRSAAGQLAGIARKEGLISLWRGLDAAMLLNLPLIAIYLPCYDYLQGNFGERYLGSYGPLVAGEQSFSKAFFLQDSYRRILPLGFIEWLVRDMGINLANFLSFGMLEQQEVKVCQVFVMLEQHEIKICQVQIPGDEFMPGRIFIMHVIPILLYRAFLLSFLA